MSDLRKGKRQREKKLSLPVRQTGAEDAKDAKKTRPPKPQAKEDYRLPIHPALFTFYIENHFMTKEDFNDLVRRLKRGDNSALSYLHPFQQRCIRMLVTKSGGRCDQDQAYDLFVDCILDFWKNVLRDRVSHQNIAAYIRRMCWNKWLAHVRTKQRQETRTGEVRASLYDSDNIQTRIAMEEIYTTRMKIMKEAMDQLSVHCRNILYMAIAEELSMAEIADRLEMASSDVAKTTKSRCYKKLMEVIRNSQKP